MNHEIALIKCPECQLVQTAQKTEPPHHHCTRCGYEITEADWEEADWYEELWNLATLTPACFVHYC